MKSHCAFFKKYNDLIASIRLDFDQLEEQKIELLRNFEKLQTDSKKLRENWYKPLESDDVDMYLADYCNALSCEIQIQRYDRGIYYLGTRRVYFCLRRDNLLMRRGAGFKNAHDFLDEFYQ